MRRAIWLVLVGAAVAGCGPALPPPALGELAQLLEGADGAPAAAAAPEAWSEAVRYLRLSQEAQNRRDEATAERFAELGRLHARIALVGVRERTARERTEAAMTEQARLTAELERVEEQTARLEQEVERERIRAHLLEVVAADRLQAAAEEELREQGLGPEERRALGEARQQVGRALMERILHAQAALAALEDAGLVAAERILPVSGAADAAREALERRELAEVQRQAEIAGVIARRVLEEIWPAGSAASAIEQLRAAVQGAGIAVVVEEHWLRTTVAVRGKQKLDRATAVEVGRLTVALAEIGEARYRLRTIPSADAAAKRATILLVPLPASEEP